MSRTKAEQAERDEAIATLLTVLKPGSEVRVTVLHVSRSGMQREIECLTIDSRDPLRNCEECQGHGASCETCHGKGTLGEAPSIWNISYLVARAIGSRIGKHGGVVMGGCGMDMAWHTVYLLGCALWPNGTPTPHGRRNGQPDSAGGYALKSNR